MLVNKKLITINLEANTKEEVITKLAFLAHLEGRVTSPKDYIESVLEREKTCTTGIGNGIAIPHGKSEAVKEAIIVFAKTSKGASRLSEQFRNHVVKKTYHTIVCGKPKQQKGVLVNFLIN